MPQPVYTYTTLISGILSSVSTDIRSQLSATLAPDSTILLDYTDRVSKEILRKSRWIFLLSDVERFVTQTGIQNYWIGPVGTGPTSAAETGLNLASLRKIRGDSVLDRSNFRRLQEVPNAPLSTSFAYADSTARLGRPAQWQQNQTNPYIFTLWPAPDNQNNYSPVPDQPLPKAAASASSLPQRTYRLAFTYVDARGNESTPSSPTKIFLPQNSLLEVAVPVAPIASAIGVTYPYVNIYAVLDNSIGEFSVATDDLIFQANLPLVDAGSYWNEPPTGLLTSGNNPPTYNNVEPIDGYVIEFEYYKQRAAITSVNQVLQIPDDYKDIVVAGVSGYAWKFLGRDQDAMLAFQKYRDGITQIVGDINWNSDAPDFISPDPASIQYPAPFDEDEYGYSTN